MQLSVTSKAKLHNVALDRASSTTLYSPRKCLILRLESWRKVINDLWTWIDYNQYIPPIENKPCQDKLKIYIVGINARYSFSTVGYFVDFIFNSSRKMDDLYHLRLLGLTPASLGSIAIQTWACKMLNWKWRIKSIFSKDFKGAASTGNLVQNYFNIFPYSSIVFTSSFF